MLSKETRLEELWEELLEQKPTNEDLRYIIVWVEPLRKEAGQRLLEQKPTNEDLRYITVWVEPLRKEAQKLLRREKKEIIEEMRRIA